jgi:hypothetical protein
MSTHVQFLSLTTDLVIEERHFPDDTADTSAMAVAQDLANANHEAVFGVSEYGDTYLAQPRIVNSGSFRPGNYGRSAYSA